MNQNLRDWAVGLLSALLIVGSLLVIGKIQANQYRKAVDRIDRGVKAITCVFEIDPSKLPPPNDPRHDAAVHRVIQACLSKYGIH